ncbi:MAG: 16S rRNA (cytosine(1402)-N(4))-methyltransferase RsmH [Candidatus Marinimicrobia bacterium]|nr:16S rRNA (cytosine(1402)-N(4))-methyltransferase RsmH [Candidatus Neomarinimicrobiota bacterium]MDP6568284.1 16S rRNA (cytosine(1402)-N(4))-methyltransferase RsmH [Candidatus Neomarinimicrobiota bacterium]MDP7025972.1 16S rRNA (cytosine(1402)-N(4))-methyltransferase RsmH [Candidatus Neomarinimicrobiota bacterium]
MASKWPSNKLTHIPVLLKETVDYLNIKRDGIYLDGTVGLGGHAAAILSLLSENGTLVGIDLDEEALTRCKESIGAASNCHLISDTFSNIPSILETLNLSQIDGLLLDLGISSLQLDSPKRGFSYRFNGPLHMGFSMTSSITANEIINTWSESELRKIIKKYGEDRMAGSVAKTIVQQRSKSAIDTTTQLRKVISTVVPPRYLNKSLSRIFQALRISVNSELDALTEVLKNFMNYLKPGGRMVTISYHSLEDRIVKQAFRGHAKECICPPKLPICQCDHKATVKILTSHPIIPSEDEINTNSRSRSAKLRAVERL